MRSSGGQALGMQAARAGARNACPKAEGGREKGEEREEEGQEEKGGERSKTENDATHDQQRREFPGLNPPCGEPAAACAITA